MTSKDIQHRTTLSRYPATFMLYFGLERGVLPERVVAARRGAMRGLNRFLPSVQGSRVMLAEIYDYAEVWMFCHLRPLTRPRRAWPPSSPVGARDVRCALPSPVAVEGLAVRGFAKEEFL